jgi:tRNA1(Val) A37 N6-methylase TrmN6
MMPQSRVLELGAGMGVAGLLAAQLTGAPVLLTDGHDTVVRLLELNRQLNSAQCKLIPLSDDILESLTPSSGRQALTGHMHGTNSQRSQRGLL